MTKRLNLLLGVIITLLGCTTNNRTTPLEAALEANALELEANRETVYVAEAEERIELTLDDPIPFKVGDRVAVEGDGQIMVRLPNLLSLEFSNNGELQLQDFRRTEDAEESVTIVMQQNGGLSVSNVQSERRANHQFLLKSGLTTVISGGARFLVAQDKQLTWIVHLGPKQNNLNRGEIQETEAADYDLHIAVGEAPVPIPHGRARWVGPDRLISEPFEVDLTELEAWIDDAQEGEALQTIDQVLFEPADILGGNSLSNVAEPGYYFDLETNSEQGTIKMMLDPLGLFGKPIYGVEDCNGDGYQDIAIKTGKIHFDFRAMTRRVNALDVTVLNYAESGQGALWGLNPAQEKIAHHLLQAEAQKRETLTIRSPQLYHFAELAINDGCFLGFSLTPPTSSGVPAPPRSTLDTQPQSSVVVNTLADNPQPVPEQESTPSDSSAAAAPAPTPPPRQFSPPAERSQHTARSVEAGNETVEAIRIDGQIEDWDNLSLNWLTFNTITYNEACNTRHPEGQAETDLSGQVRFAYDSRFLYVSFLVTDDGYVGYSGEEMSYFQGDSVQLSLDTNLLSDYTDPNRSDDDWQIDFLPDPDGPRVALWKLDSLTVRNFTEALVAVSPTSAGYYLEAALPWQAFNISPQSGDRLGIAANVNDNDTPGTNVQECIISTAPQREWNVPPTWGVLTLQ